MRRNIRLKAWLLLLIFLAEMITPNIGFSLGSGPSQPEMATFTPAGTTEMVDPFSGDFSYNIPLMDVEGYPINISYNSDVTMEQEASWVGLGWNLNVGAVTRSVRGLPDDFKGEEIKTMTNIEPMKITKVGGSIGAEVFGLEELGAITAGLSLSFIRNNYKGFGIVLEPSLGASVESGGMKLNGNKSLSLNTLDGASINSSIGVSVSGLNDKGQSMSFGLSKGSGFNTRTGQQVLSFGTSAGYSVGKSIGGSATFLPIGLETYTPYPSLEMASVTRSYSASIGGEVYGVNANASTHGSVTEQSPALNMVKTGSGLKPTYEWGKWKSTKAYGYFNLEEASDNDLRDFNRGKSVQINNTVKNLATTSLTYDVYSVSGQGVSGMFRPFRNDIGVISDPKLGRTKNSDEDELGLEFGLGAYFHGGGNFNTTNVFSEYGPWLGGAHSNYKFLPAKLNSTYEKFYMKSAGDLAENDLDFYDKVGKNEAVAFKLNGMYTDELLVKKDGSTLGLFPNNTYDKDRKARSKHLALFSAEEANAIHNNNIISYKNQLEVVHSPISSSLVEVIDRITVDKKAHHVSELVQTNQDGERFVFGIPAYNLKKVEKYFSTNIKFPNDQMPIWNSNGTSSSLYDYFNTGNPVSFGRVIPTAIEDSRYGENKSGVDHFYSEKEIPAYAHSYLLTEKKSADYRDVTGNGVSSDDVGNAWKFNYTRTSDDFGWRMPYSNANFMPGFLADPLDNKASYSYGTKELWYTHSVESKNYVAEFITSPREDGVGAKIPREITDPSDPNKKIHVDKEGGLPDVIDKKDKSYKLEQIVLYNKYDRLMNGAAAVPVKTVYFNYDYNLCKGIENQINRGDGKLTLRSIEISYGANNQNRESAYEFNYSGESYVGVDASGATTTIQIDGVNPNYSPMHIDRWGYYKHSRVNPKTDMTNEYFPYAFQESSDPVDNPDNWAGAWSLREITTPSNGKIMIDYEVDEYAYVQDKVAMQMFPVTGVSNSSNGSKDNILYNGSTHKNRLWIKRPTNLPTNLTPDELKERFFGSTSGLENMYFRFKVDVRSKDEYVSGYVNAVQMGYSADETELFIDLAGNKNPIVQASWGFLRENLFNVVYDQPSVENDNVDALVKGIRANLADIRQMFTGVEDYLKRKSIAKEFVQHESFIRLNNPMKRKKGGGSRVKSIRINDNWSEMQTGEQSREYGQNYEYNTVDEKGNVISSGVASYESIVGNDENPFRMPVPYVSKMAQNHIPAIGAFQETPFGEEFFPSASIGYSNVVVKNIHYNENTTSNSITENKFYTAKDFPTFVEYTKLDPSQKFHDPSKPGKMTFPVVGNRNKSRYSASQGYSIVLNDMHGKQFSTETYTIQDHPDPTKAALGEKIKKIIGGVKYHYQVDETSKGKQLNNKVQVISADGSVGEKLLGVEYDVCIDSRFSYNEISTTSVKGNLDIIPLPPVPPSLIPLPLTIPMGYYTSVKDIKELKTLVLTKVIQQYGLIESVTTYTDQYATTVYNKMYDGTTGQVLLTETKDEYQDPDNNANEFQFTIPAYLTTNLERMGPNYLNNGFEGELIKEYRGAACITTGVFQNNGEYYHGDQVIITKASDGTTQKAWINMDFLNQGVNNPLVKNYCDKKLYTMFKTGQASNLNEIFPNDNTPIISSYNRSIILNNQVSTDVKFYLPSKKLQEYFIAPTVEFQFNQRPFKEALELTVNNKFGLDLAGNKTIFSNLGFSDEHGVSDVNLYGLNELFRTNEPIDANLIFNNSDNLSVFEFDLNDVIDNEDFMRLINNDNNLSNDGFFDAYFLVEVTYTGNATPEKVYFIHTYEFNHEYKFLNPSINKEVTYHNPGIDAIFLVNPLNNNASCPFSFELIDKYGNPITNVTDGDKIKVIRSGNQNMLTANEGVIISDENPIEVEGGKFKGIKSASDINITQISAQEYSDTYEVEENYATNIPNKFTTGSDSKFKVVKIHRYNAERKQNSTQVETAKDGYFVDPPPLWTKEPSDCYFRISSPIQTDLGNWRTEEEIVKFNQDGVSTEAKNSLDIYSSVFTNFNGKVETVASNSNKNCVAVENFEDYEYLHETRQKIKSFSMLDASSVSNSAVSGGVVSLTTLYTPFLPQKHEEILVKGIAHTGNYSIFLKGANNDVYPGNIINYNENRLQSLVAATLGNEDKQVGKTLDLNQHSYPTSPVNLTATEQQFQTGTLAATEFQNAVSGSNGQNELSYHINANSVNSIGFNPKGGEYYFSVWVKEILPSNSEYKAISPSVKVLNSNAANAVTYNINSKEIDGWYQITGEFTYDETKQLDFTLDGGLWGAFFDDLRIHPVESNVKTYVFDQKTGRLKAQLDENNYATIYEYNTEGILSQTKRETAAGVYTVTESRQGLRRR